MEKQLLDGLYQATKISWGRAMEKNMYKKILRLDAL